MAGRKNRLLSYKIISSGNMSSNITSSVTNIQYLDAIGIQLNWTGSPVGTFQIQVSMDYAQDDNGNVTNTGNWIPLTLSPSPATTAGSPIYIDLLETSAPWIRTVYTASSSTGTLNAYISGKMK